MIQDTDATTLIRKQYEAWAEALRTHDFQWLEDNLADDYQFSARPHPELRLNKAEFIEADKKIQSADIRLIVVKAERIGDEILSIAVADVAEQFVGDMGAHMPSLGEINELVGNNRLGYASAWRQHGERWQCYHHHMVGVVGR